MAPFQGIPATSNDHRAKKAIDGPVDGFVVFDINLNKLCVAISSWLTTRST
jgi:hypothetical protein